MGSKTNMKLILTGMEFQMIKIWMMTTMEFLIGEMKTTTVCNTKCLEEYLDQARVQCAEPQCDAKFERKFGARSKGKWYCKAHSKGKEAVGIMYSSSEPKSCHKHSFLE